MSSRSNPVLSVCVRNGNVEQIFVYSGCHKKLEALTTNKIQATRYLTNPTIGVLAKTFGSKSEFNLKTVDISKTGMLLESKKEDLVPFIRHTLLEIKMLEKGAWLEQPINCLGKVVRCYKDQRDVARSLKFFGVEIVELEPRAQPVWQETLLTLSDRSLGKNAA